MDVKRGIIVIIFCLMAAVAYGQPPGQRCGEAADVVFVLDVSSSIWPGDFQHVRTFVRDVISEMDVGRGQDQTRVAAITFSSGVQLEFPLYRYLNKERLEERALHIQLRGGNTNTHLALQYVDKNVFRPNYGARPNVSRVVIVITDGVSRKVKDTREAAEVLRDKGATIFAIGVGKQRNRAELEDMASHPADLHVFEVTNFTSLNDIKEEFVNKACKVSSTTTTTTTTMPPTTTTTTTTTTMPPTTTTTPPPSPSTFPTTTTTTPPSTTTTPLDDKLDIFMGDRPGEDVDTGACSDLPADVYFVLDSSSSIWKHDFNQNVLSFVRDVIDLYDVGSDHTRVGIITYSDAAHIIFGLNAYSYKDELKKAVNEYNVQYTPGGTDTAQALRVAGYQLEREGRSNVQQTLILITDGQSMDPGSTIATARALRHRGVRVMAVGVGESVDEGELHAVTGGEVVMMVGDFESLANHTARLAERSCAPVGDGPYTPLPVEPTRPPYRCRLGQADVVFAYDWSTLGSWVVSHLTTTIHHLTTTLRARGTDVWLGTMTSGACLGHQALPLSSGEVFGKYSGRLVRSQLHQVMNTVRLSAFTSSNGHRMQARKVVVAVLDPASSSVVQEVALEAAQMRQRGVEMFVVTSGRQDQQLLRSFSHVIQLPQLDFSNAAFASDVIARALCGNYRQPYY